MKISFLKTKKKIVPKNQNVVLKTFLLLKYQKLLTFLVKNPNKNRHDFLGAFTWNHPLLTYCDNLAPLGGSPVLVSNPFQDDGERERSDHVRNDTPISRRQMACNRSTLIVSDGVRKIFTFFLLSFNFGQWQTCLILTCYLKWWMILYWGAVTMAWISGKDHCKNGQRNLTDFHGSFILKVSDRLNDPKFKRRSLLGPNLPPLYLDESPQTLCL